MLDPDYLEQAGGLVTEAYEEIESRMLDILVVAMLDEDLMWWRAQAALHILPMRKAAELRAVLEEHSDKVTDAVRAEVEDALRRSDAHDRSVIMRALGVDLPQIPDAEVAYAVKTVTEMLARDNVDLMNGARDAFFRESAWAVTQTAVGVMSYDEAVFAATRRLARKGIEMVQYRDPTTGNLTVRSAADVAVRRHVRTQLAQSCADRTMAVCERSGCGFVEVTSHYGARPSHQDWEGRCYSLHGRVTVDGVTYEDFGEATGYYGTGDHGALGDRLQGVNCRHHFGPWVPGMPHAFEPSPTHPGGKTSEEIYRLTQRQRAMERRIRECRRDVAAVLRNYEAHPDERTLAAARSSQAALDRQVERLERLISENSDVLTREINREWTGYMPRVRLPKGE